jgi:hypothetical protein
MAVPILSDVDMSRPRFKDGDRLIARVSTELRADQRLILTKTIRKFAHAEVRPWIVNCLKTSVDLIRAGRRENLVSLVHVEPDAKTKGVMNLSLGVVDFMDGDILEVTTRRMESHQIRDMQAMLRDWSGRQIEVKILAGATAL